MYDYKNPDSLTGKNSTIKNDSLSSKLVMIHNIKDTALITLKQYLPKCLTAKIILPNIPYRIEKIETKTQNVILTSFENNVNFDFQKQISFAKKKCLQKGKPVNLLFNY
ncbi:hypothetical protein CNR22_02380 [Sphingobacteriaceae bacterium]|nr:hypothetical protein CNR22_02380 [Sphingobacteriaceae bacterium]